MHDGDEGDARPDAATTADEKAVHDAFAKKVKALRTAKGLSRPALAERLHVDRTTISNWERGKSFPKDDVIARAARLFGVTVNSLVSVDKDVLAPVAAELIEGYEQLPRLLMELLANTVSTVKGSRVAARYATAAGVQMEFRTEIARRIGVGTLIVDRLEVVYGLERLREIVFNILRYDPRHYRVKVLGAPLPEAVPAMGGYSFDDAEFLLGAYWDKTPPPTNAHSLLLRGDVFHEYFKAYWEEIWRRGAWLNEQGPRSLPRAKEIAMQLGMPESGWRDFVDEARIFEVGDGAPPLF